jgi:VWFA-related protein
MLNLLLLLPLMQDLPTFRSGVALVHVDAEVRQEVRQDVRQQTQLVDGLRPQDFLVFDAGKRQTIVHFGHEEAPLDVILLFDTSASMRPAVARIAEAAHTALSELHEGDRVAVMAFDASTDLIADFTGDFAAAEDSIAKQVLPRRFRCCSPIQGALETAARVFLKQPGSDRRRAIVVITDDEGTSRDQGAIRQLWEADAVVLGVIVRSTAHSIRIGPPSSYGYKGMRDIAGKTGGDMLKTRDAADGLREVLHRLRSRYSLYYALPRGKPGEARKIEVRLSSEAARQYPAATIRARAGYVLP